MPQPLDMVRALLSEEILVKLRNNRELRGTLHGYDEHCNMVLGDVEETVFSFDDNNQIQKQTARSDMLLVRGDTVILIRQ
ncbi:U6 snRNA-associated Sm-like protein LSm3 [Wickerhamiella sorbophila]|uniref:U6 snRNA-associated Sm-like protein LSm3 n=1 Tax=Wickerhamiella sorbophila TaxID=45607 RepID=A0A2T0FKD9_9ASCO|nr:U6 snRNA-associated Sm-like protein LSm3 [Wickerhamiella sorbophila]PRT55456.1 U6 snRNA-associated Sm-like protein LSm3 [Wickerhamiella sorbophila]